MEGILVQCHSLFFGFIEGGMGKAVFARGDFRNNTGKSRCIPTLRRATWGLAHATRRAGMPADNIFRHLPTATRKRYT